MDAEKKYLKEKWRLEKVIKKNPNDAAAFYALGTLARERYGPAQGVGFKEFKRAADLNPASFEANKFTTLTALNQIGYYCFEITESGEERGGVSTNELLAYAEKYGRRALQINPLDGGVRRTLCLALFRTDKKKECEEVLKEGCELGVEWCLKTKEFLDAFIMYQVNPKYFGTNYNKEIAMLETIAEFRPESPDLWSNLGVLYAEVREDYKKALECFEKVVKLDPLFPNAKSILQMLRKRLGLSSR